MATARELELLDALEATLEWIDAVPQETVLPVMPGFDRDWVNGLVEALRAERAKPKPPLTKGEKGFIADYKAAYAAANPDMPEAVITKSAGGWYQMTPCSGNAYRRSDIERMTQVLLARVGKQ